MSTEKVTIQQRRANRDIYYQEQHVTTEKYVAPYINQYHHITPQSRILEIGCGEGGNLKYFIDQGCEVVGIDIAEGKIANAEKLCSKFCDDTSNLTLICEDIYDTDGEKLGRFDVIMMRDVIEHIPDQERFLSYLKTFVKKDGIIFFGFPPWQMPFGGHQQGCQSVLSKVPYFHLLPNPLYKGVLKMFGEPDRRINSLMQTKSTGISIERFKKYSIDAGWKIIDESPYLINPNYEAKFHLSPRKQNSIINNLPYIRKFLTTGAYYIIGREYHNHK